VTSIPATAFGTGAENIPEKVAGLSLLWFRKGSYVV
jgi:hypothetical protein